jgi:transcription-repair coupling factor (superfamily II helicase)
MTIKFNINKNTINRFYNLPAGSEALPLIEIIKNSNNGVVHVCKNDVYLEKIHDLIKFFSKDIEIFDLPAWDTNPYDKVSPNSEIISNRLQTLTAIKNGLSKNQVLLTTANAFNQKIIPVEVIKNSSLEVKVKQKIKRDDLLGFLVNNSYINVSAASDHGEFSVRGSIIDIYPPSSEFGIRIDFFGDDIESIRKYDPLTQISTSEIKEYNIIPASEILLNAKYIERFKENFIKNFGVTTAGKEPVFDAVCEGRKYIGFENYIPLFYDRLDTVFDYCVGATITFEHDVEGVFAERFEQIKDSYNSRIVYAKSGRYDNSDNFLEPHNLYIIDSELDEVLKNKTVIYFSKFDRAAGENGFAFEYRPAENYFAESKIKNISSIDLLKNQLFEEFAKSGKTKNIIACFSSGSRDRLAGILSEHNLNYVLIDDIEKELALINKTNVGLCIVALDSGFKAENYNIISEADLLGERIFRKKKTRGRKAEDFIREAATLTVGELVVHKEHGIGRFKGLETLAINKTQHDFILIEYRDGDKLYVPVENIELISRFGAEEEGVELDKLGGLNWQERTAKIKKRIKDIAADLIKIAAEREVKTASVFERTGAFDEFCARFPYTETEDQLFAIDEVLNDLNSGKPMDRLICGDVGFGKTEVALRAAFNVVQNNTEQKREQVAVICPTTLLCRQHFNTFTERFAGTGVVIKQLSRMVTTTEIRKNKEAAKNGEVDIIIGTHSLLSNNLEFKNLSLLIIDEEQRFGVAQKEKLKKLRSETHVLTLTATPIPRTLQLSLSGIRDLSLIATPPVDRLAVRTFVMPFDEVTIREAILKEHYRGGRSYFVAPRIKDLDEIEPKLKQLIPEVKFVKAHGKMKPDELDEIMNDFYEGKFDVLLATTIVESGLDVPAANTIILHRADMFGLAQLYQLRGRVGRSKVRAYAYLTVPPKRQLTKHAEKRLAVMQKLDSLGAGFTLASYDMDIRGFGNLLGDEQSGNIREVGVELYQNMLQEAIESLKTSDFANQEEIYSIKLNLGISVLIPESFVTDSDLRMGLYRRLGGLETNEDIESFAVELRDRFGKLPEEVENLLETIKIKFLCRKLDIEKLDAGEIGASVQFRNNKFRNPDALIKLIAKNPVKYKIKDGSKFVIANCNWKDLKTRVIELKKVLEEISKFVESESSKAA